MRTRHHGTMIGRLGAGFLVLALAGCASTNQATPALPGEIALGGSATATSAVISAAGYSCGTPGHGPVFTTQLCQRPGPTEELVPPDSMIRIYSRPDDSVAGLDVDVLGPHATLSGSLTTVLRLALAPTVSAGDASKVEAFVTAHLPTTAPGTATAAVSSQLTLMISDDGGVIQASLWAPDVVAWRNALLTGTATHPPPSPPGS
jgi:hypothetical protein